MANKDLDAMVSENVTLKEASAEANQKLAEVKTELEALQLSIKVYFIDLKYIFFIGLVFFLIKCILWSVKWEEIILFERNYLVTFLYKF